jgi:hypothetical protein
MVSKKDLINVSLYDFSYPFVEKYIYKYSLKNFIHYKLFFLKILIYVCMNYIFESVCLNRVVIRLCIQRVLFMCA